MPIPSRTKKGTVKPVVVTYEQLDQARRMIAFGLEHHQVAEVLGVTKRTFSRHYAPHLKDAKAHVDSKAFDTLTSVMLDKDHPKCITALIFYLKTRCGFRETDRLEVAHEVKGEVRELFARWTEPEARRD